MSDVSSLRLMERVRGAIQMRHYSRRTEEAYAAWIRRHVGFHRFRHPSELGAEHVSTFLSWLATDRRVSASTQNQALSAVLFLYREGTGHRCWLERRTSRGLRMGLRSSLTTCV
jgi:hypothetical protein